jgi:phenylpropionate dioxygenase-like ring-hydroxylating dioxygenase large terminal subunit
MKPKYLKNAWYAAALSTEVEGAALFHRKILDTSIMVYRLADGSPVALHDRCPHRFAPLHMGKRDGDEVSCFYHALKFNAGGICTHNPHGNGNIPDGAKVRTFPLSEQYGFIWIWMGDAPADLSKLPDFSELDNGSPNAVGYTYMPMNANYELIIDNVMDLSHIDHVHGEIISTRGQLSPKIAKIRSTERMGTDASNDDPCAVPAGTRKGSQAIFRYHLDPARQHPAFSWCRTGGQGF